MVRYVIISNKKFSKKVKNYFSKTQECLQLFLGQKSVKALFAGFCMVALL